MSYWVWICTADAVPESLPGAHPDAGEAEWQRIGFIDTQVERDLMTEIQKALGLRAGRPRGVAGYITAHVEQPWVHQVVTANPSFARGYGAADLKQRFWVAIDVAAGATEHRYLISVRQAQFARVARHPPEAHPGLAIPTCPLPVQIRSRNGVVFNVLEA